MGSKRSFQIANWAAWAPGISSVQQWQDFQQGILAINPDATADVKFLPAMQRRRLSPLARAAFHVTEQVMENADPCPSIFCSTYGEAQRTYSILNDIAREQDISPTSFSLSVHNAISGQFTIFFNNTQPTTAMAPSEDNYLLPFVDALGQLQENAASVLLVFYEEALPEFYQPYVRSTDYPCALALRISARDNGSSALFHLDFDAQNPPVTRDDPTPILQLIEFLANPQKKLTIGNWTLSQQ